MGRTGPIGMGETGGESRETSEQEEEEKRARLYGIDNPLQPSGPAGGVAAIAPLQGSVTWISAAGAARAGFCSFFATRPVPDKVFFFIQSRLLLSILEPNTTRLRSSFVVGVGGHYGVIKDVYI